MKYDMNSNVSITHRLLDPLTNIEIAFCIYSLFFNMTVFMWVYIFYYTKPL